MRVFVLVVRLVCLPIAVWGVYGFGGPTLTDIVERNLGFSPRGAAALLSVVVGVLITISLIPARKSYSPDRKDQGKVDSQ